jgi:hypothetical protein
MQNSSLITLHLHLHFHFFTFVPPYYAYLSISPLSSFYVVHTTRSTLLSYPTSFLLFKTLIFSLSIEHLLKICHSIHSLLTSSSLLLTLLLNLKISHSLITHIHLFTIPYLLILIVDKV